MNELRDLYTPPDTFQCFLCYRSINNLRSGLEGHIQNYHRNGIALDENGQPIRKKIVRRRTINNNTIEPAENKTEKGSLKKCGSKRGRSKKRGSKKKKNNQETELPSTARSILPDDDDYPVPYDKFLYNYTFEEYQALILNYYNWTPFVDNHQSGPTTTATLTEISADADQHQNTNQPDHQFKVPEVPPLHVNLNVVHSNSPTVSTSSGGEGVVGTGDAIKTLGSDAKNVVDYFFRGSPTTTATLIEISADADQHQNTSQPDHQFNVPEVNPLRFNLNFDYSNSLMAGTSSGGGYVFADEHLWNPIDYASFTD